MNIVLIKCIYNKCTYCIVLRKMMCTLSYGNQNIKFVIICTELFENVYFLLLGLLSVFADKRFVN